MTTSAQIRPVLAIHGGAGTIQRAVTTAAQLELYQDALRAVLRSAEGMLACGGGALEVAVEAVRLLEECELFNAGRGAVYTADGRHELDASVMHGAGLRAGAVAGLRRTRNPVLAARAVMESSGHVMLVGDAADDFARQQGLEQVPPDWFGTVNRREQLARVRAEAGGVLLDHDAQSLAASPLDERKKFGTVGAVVLDAQGHLAAATSTGGMTNKRPGRVGDSPVIGAGCYADDTTAAVSCTGTGEAFMRVLAAYDVSARMAYLGSSLDEAARHVVHERLPLVGGQGGMIAVSRTGALSMPFNTEGMYRGFVRPGAEPEVAIFR